MGFVLRTGITSTNYIKTNRNQTKTIMGSCQAPFSESALVGTGGV